MYEGMKGSVDMLTNRPRGTRDFLPEELVRWQYVEEVARRVCRRYSYGEIRTPLFEHTELFERGVGEGTDIVEKEMYTFSDRGGRSLTLRPEGTAPVMRAFLEEGLRNQALPKKLFYIPYQCFRYERPQAGRYRQHHQFGVEVIGSSDPLIDVEVIALAGEFLAQLGLENFGIRLNSIGCPECRVEYRESLRQYMSDQADLCQVCRSRLETNPLRILDCKNPRCRELAGSAPAVLDYLCAGCREHFSGVRAGLSSLGLEYQLDSSLVRGLDYYTHTVFEIFYRGLGAQDALLGGGRYDGLAESLGGEPCPGMGFAMGLERILLAMEEEGCYLPGPEAPEVFLVAMGDEPRASRMALLARLRRAGLNADTDFMDRSMRAQMRLAARAGSRAALIVGEDELEKGQAALRLLDQGSQMQVSLEDLGQEVRTALDQAIGEGDS